MGRSQGTSTTTFLLSRFIRPLTTLRKEELHNGRFTILACQY